MEPVLKIAPRIVPAKPEPANRLNTLTGLLEGLGAYAGIGNQTIAQPFTLADNVGYAPLSLNRILLSQAYMSIGLVQTVVAQPVDDAFRGGVEIEAPELSSEEVKAWLAAFTEVRSPVPLNRMISPSSVLPRGKSDLEAVKETLNWARLFGGAGLIVNTDQNFAKPFDPEKVTADSPLEFIAADRWELILTMPGAEGTPFTNFNYYGLPLHRTRVTRAIGVEPPSWVRQRLQGWGMSEIERCLRAINSFLKLETMIFELIDEAKTDVFKIMGFNEALLSDDGTAQIQKRIAMAARLKNFQRSLAMDTQDDYEQKQIHWSGLADLWMQVRLNLSSALKIPMNKLFGESATGFGGGQDAVENYNSVVEGVRSTATPLVRTALGLRARQLFGYEPEFAVKWPTLRVLDGVQEEQVLTSRQNRTLELFRDRLINGEEASQILHRDKLLTLETEVLRGEREVEAPDDVEIAAAAATAAAKTGAQGKPAQKKK